jgi:hypothetical protein
MADRASMKQNSPDLPTTYLYLITNLDGTCYYGAALAFYEQLNNDDGIYSESSLKSFYSLNRLIGNYNRTSGHQHHSRSSFI